MDSMPRFGAVDLHAAGRQGDAEGDGAADALADGAASGGSHAVKEASVALSADARVSRMRARESLGTGDWGSLGSACSFARAMSKGASARPTTSEMSQL